MSGGYKAMRDGNNGWVTWQPASKSFLSRYKDRMVIIIGKGRTRCIYLTDAVLKHLNRPEYVVVMTRGTNIAFGVGSGENGYKVQYPENSTAVGAAKPSTASLTAIGLVKGYGLESGVYDCHPEGNLVVMDSRQTPSRL